MSEYVTLIIDEEFLRNTLIIIFSFLSICSILFLVDVVFKEVARTRKKEKIYELKKRDLPYVKEFERLKKEGKFEEASDYLKENSKYLKNDYCYL